MSKKAKKEEKIPQLTPAEYWEWRCTIEERRTAKLTKDLVLVKRELMVKDAEILKQKIAMFKDSILASDEMLKNSEEEYERFKGQLEERLEMKLSGCTINEDDYTVRKLD